MQARKHPQSKHRELKACAPHGIRALPRIDSGRLGKTDVKYSAKSRQLGKRPPDRTVVAGPRYFSYARRILSQFLVKIKQPLHFMLQLGNLVDAITFVQSSKGTRVIVKAGYRYCYHRLTKDGHMRWVCSTNSGSGCRAYIYTLGDGYLRSNEIHNHPKLKEYVNPILKTCRANFITSSKGTPCLIYSGFKYCIHTRSRISPKIRWKCSSHKKCGSAVFTIGDHIVGVKNAHSYCAYRPSYM
ncbi:hypothetical protein EVAR_17885_1 [Eumeta japonica]|uniref:FLYWCH-type domain-containing protein n=1 Tax=Eumeta variegata TaxID=151549 RepID=A0A4C1UZF8_EUMVA|nr:hypothetical protein EVAR_17885_1 [Eumeta japonica]